MNLFRLRINFSQNTTIGKGLSTQIEEYAASFPGQNTTIGKGLSKDIERIGGLTDWSKYHDW